MAKTKTVWTNANVNTFIKTTVESEQKQKESFELIKLMESVSGFKPKMWGPTIIGFGKYHYKYATGHEGDAPILGFSPRKAAFSLYVYCGVEEHRHLLDNLGKFTMGKVCIYVKKLSDINTKELTKLMKASIKYINEKYPEGK